LEWDHNTHINDKETQDKYLQSILVCPAYHAEKLRNGTHLNELGHKMEHQNRKKWNTIIKDDNPRYHYLKECEEYQIPELAIDFKHYYSIPRDILYKEMKTHMLELSMNYLENHYRSDSHII